MITVFYFRGDQFMEELENEEVNRELCALAVEDMFESWSPETQEQVLAEWNDWQKGHHCVECGKVFTRPDCLKRHVRRSTLEKSRLFVNISVSPSLMY